MGAGGCGGRAFAYNHPPGVYLGVVLPQNASLCVNSKEISLKREDADAG